MKRSRGRGRRSGGGGNNPNRHFESNGPGVKIRGSAQQILDKYQQYARDAQSSGDRVGAENHLQHAEHYYRVLAAMKPPEKPKQEPRENESKDEASTGEEAAAPDANSEEPKETRSRNRSRSRDRDKQKSKSEEQEAAKADGDSEASEASEKAPKEERPKRRRTYKKRASSDADGENDDGVMKTLSRGSKASPADAADAPVVDAD